MATLTERMLGAARLEVATYEEVEHDQNATGQAVVRISFASASAFSGESVTSVSSFAPYCLKAARTTWLASCSQAFPLMSVTSFASVSGRVMSPGVPHRGSSEFAWKAD